MKVVIDPTEDLFSYSPSLRKLIGESKVPSLPQPTNAEVFETLDSGPINPTNANLGFSMFNGNITRRTGKKLTVYQLLLDSQLELRSDGDKITCNKAGKRRKKLCAASTSAVGDIHGAGRSPYMTVMEAALNSGEPDKIRKYFQDFCTEPNCSLQIDMSALSGDPSIPVFRDIRGVNSICSYFIATVQALPDCIYLFWQKSVTKNNDGTKEIKGECHMEAKRLYEILVLENENVHEDLESAIFGLASLSSGKAELQPNTVYCSNFPKAKDEVNESNESSTLQWSVNSKGQRCKVRSLDTMNILVADSNVEFAIGRVFPTPVDVNNRGSFSWIVDSNHKVIRMKMTLYGPSGPNDG